MACADEVPNMNDALRTRFEGWYADLISQPVFYNSTHVPPEGDMKGAMRIGWEAAVKAMHSGNDADQVLVSKADLRDWQAQYTEENADGEHDCITPYDKYLY
jgi:hypothetical protein